MYYCCILVLVLIKPLLDVPSANPYTDAKKLMKTVITPLMADNIIGSFNNE